MSSLDQDWGDITPPPSSSAAMPTSMLAAQSLSDSDWGNVMPPVQSKLSSGPIIGEPTAVSSLRQEMTNDNGIKDRGAILPLGRDEKTGKVTWAVPEMLRSLGRGALDIYEAPFGSQEALQNPQVQSDIVNTGMLFTPKAPGITTPKILPNGSSAEFGPPSGGVETGINPNPNAPLRQPLNIRPDVTDAEWGDVIPPDNILVAPVRPQLAAPPKIVATPKPPSPPPYPDEGFRTTPGAIAAEHAADVSSLEAQGAQLAGEKHIPKLGGDGSPENPVVVAEPQDLDLARERVEQPSEAQKEAGNYQKGHIELQGLPITIENPIGSTRSGIGADGEPWSVQMPADYGYIKRTVGADNDHVDTYIGPNPKSDRVFVIDQNDAHTGQFDEHKAFVGFDSPEQVTSTYRGAFSDGLGQERIGAVYELTMPAFKEQLKSGDWTKPLSAQPIAERKPGSEPPSTPFNMYMDARAYTPKEQSFINDVKDIAGRIMPDANVSVFNRIRQGEDKVTGLSFANGLKDAVAISLESKNPVRTMQHEAIHFLRNYLTHDEWATLENAADKEGWHDKHNIDERYGEIPDDIKTEEAIASEFGDYRSGKPTSPAASPIFAKMKDFLDNLKTAFRRRFGTKATAQDIFKDIHEGIVGKRAPRDEAVQPKTEVGGEGGDGKPPPGEEFSDVPPEKENSPSLFDWIRSQEDELYKLRGRRTARELDARNKILSLPDDVKNPVTNEVLYHYGEGALDRPLTPKEQEIWNKYIMPVRIEKNQVFNEIRKSGVPIGLDGHMHRIVRGKGTIYDPEDGPSATNPIVGGYDNTGNSGFIAKMNQWRQWLTGNKPLEVKEPLSGGRGFTRKAPSMFSRRMWKATWEDGTQSILNGEYEPGKSYETTNGRKFKISQATTKEIEAGSNVRYFKNALANEMDELLKLQNVKDNIDYLDRLKSDPVFDMLYEPPGGQRKLPADWKNTRVPQLPGRMNPRVAAMLDNFYSVGPDGDLGKAFLKINRFLNKTLFVNLISAVFRHGANVATHGVMDRGWDNFNPLLYPKQLRNGVKAWREVMKTGSVYQKALSDSLGLMYGATITPELHRTMIKLMGDDLNHNKPLWQKIAKGARTSIPDIWNGLNRISGRGLWFFNDWIVLGRYFDYMDKGLSSTEAAKETNHGIPPYRIPTEAWDNKIGRGFSQLMRNPNLLNFSPYHYGVLHSLFKPIKEFASLNSSMKQRSKATGQLVALFAMYLAYKEADKIIQGESKNPDARLSRAGPMGLVESATSQFNDEPGGTDYQGINNITQIAPGTKLAVEMMPGVDQDFFTHKPVYNPHGSPWEIAKQIGEHTAMAATPVEQAAQILGGRKSFHETAVSYFGISEPSGTEVANKQRYLLKDYVSDIKSEARKDAAIAAGFDKLLKRGTAKSATKAPPQNNDDWGAVIPPGGH